MHKETVVYVTFLSPGSIVADQWTRDVESLDPYTVDWPDRAYAFTMHTREDVVDGAARYKGVPARVGPVYYHPDSKVETLEEVRINPNAGDILVSNMECNRWGRVVWSRWGNWPQPFEAEKAVVLNH